MNRATAYLVRTDAERVKNALGACPTSEQRCVTAVAQRVLLDSPFNYKGRQINPVLKSLGAGVWSVTHKEI